MLSVSMIVRNEARNLPRCLESIKGLADEIVVVDTGSYDGTQEIIENSGAKLVQSRWKDDFSEARNECLDHCAGDWILILDADEAIDPSDHDRIKRAMEGDYLAYNLIVRNYVPNEDICVFDKSPVENKTSYGIASSYGYYVDNVALRLFRREPDIRFTGRVHESVAPAYEARGIQIGALSAVIHHFGKVDADHERGKSELYYRLAKKDAEENPSESRFQFNLMLQAHIHGAYAEAVNAANAFMRLESKVPSIVPLVGGMGHQALGNHNAAISYFKLVLENDPNHLMALVQCAVSLCALGALDPAESLLVAASAAHGNSPKIDAILAQVRLAKVQISMGAL